MHNEDGARMVVFPTGGERGPGAAVVQIGADFIGLVMPLRAPGDAERYQRPLWAAATGADQ
ncbi:hypothetical protein H7I77_00720 [Mycolicibacterium novocastrense]|uniref:Uncharacterized protein n=1 Tax=Mycolicibacterium novocastrense TaxID=59813 RepID=A0AAW5SEY9_MYCNV|nr:hypothetical protein [Mycolicibacterium novocastrense]MCV7021876.1 hypothetical protein [Mycolicibacterium novocastrense]